MKHKRFTTIVVALLAYATVTIWIAMDTQASANTDSAPDEVFGGAPLAFSYCCTHACLKSDQTACPQKHNCLRVSNGEEDICVEWKNNTPPSKLCYTVPQGTCVGPVGSCNNPVDPNKVCQVKYVGTPDPVTGSCDGKCITESENCGEYHNCPQ